MKLIIAIVQDEDSHKLMNKLTEEGFSFTKLATTGGFLRSGNTTLLIGIEEDKVDAVIDIIERVCKTRDQYITSVPPAGGTTGMFYSQPVEVTIGGATIFVVDVDRFKKV